jgi:hypothetical protein
MKKETLTVETDEYGTIRSFNANGKLHNPAGPAMVGAGGHKEYWINDKLHNPNGPAVIHADGYTAHWTFDKKLTEVEIKAWQTQQSAPLHNKIATIDGIEYTLTAK